VSQLKIWHFLVSGAPHQYITHMRQECHNSKFGIF